MSDLFYGYPEIENSYQQGFVDRIKDEGFGKIQYMVSEKIHGANTQIDYDLSTGEFLFCKRSGAFDEGESFYNAKGIFEKLKPKIKRMSELFAKDLDAFGQHVLTVKVFGEVFGGSYPHDGVPVDRSAFRVQKGVFYSPHNEWCAFDIAYTVAGSDRVFFLPGSKFFTFCALFKLDMAPVLRVVDSLDDALAFPNDGFSRVYGKFGLPALENNVMEGVVIRPYNTDVWFGHTRLILKNKNQKFKEKSRVKKDAVPAEVSEIVGKACEEISQFITYARVRNVISHIGEVTPKDVGRVIMLTSQDVLKDYRKEYDTLDFMEKKDEKAVTKHMNGEVAKLVRDVIVFGKEGE